MYASIKGTVAEKTKDGVVLETQGVGYEIFVGARTLAELPGAGQTAKLYTYTYVREDALALYGFLQRDEKDLFLKLLGVSGVGPKLALAILGSYTVTELTMALLASDTQTLSRIPGVGKKTAERIALELRGKVNETAITGAGAPVAVSTADARTLEAVQALMALGFTSAEATRALAQTKDQTVEAMIVDALQALGSGR